MPINALTAGVAALAINSTAFTIEIFRGGFAAVPVAQHDAARALGLRPALIMALVVVPQVFRIVLPPLGNQIVSVVLGSAQASIIGVAELTYQTQSIGSSTFRYFELFTIAALFYIACAQLISLVWRLLTGRAAHAPLGLLLLLKGLAITLELSLGSLVLGSRPPQLGHHPRLLQENGTRCSRAQPSHRNRATPCSTTPHVRNSRNSRSTNCGRPAPSPASAAAPRKASRCSATT
jgi:Binding-protein-dependent transport system inner membrane component